jgi:peptidoglycan/LPS O-acetylase OafA/YrhL
LDFLRAIAILMVVSWHFPRSIIPHQLKPATWAGVDLFFVLSGYLIGSQLLRPYARGAVPSYSDFFLRRALRIIPVYAMVLLAYLTLPVLWEAPGMKPAWRYITFTMNFGLDQRTAGAFAQTWSLCVEEHFYLVLPLIVYWLMRRPSFAKAAVVATAIAVSGMVLRGVLWMSHVEPVAPGDYERAAEFLRLIYFPTWCRLDGLLVGVVIAAARLFRPDWWARATLRGNALLAAGAGLLVLSLWMCQSMFSFATALVGYPLLAASYGLLVMSALSPSSILSRRRVPGATLVAALSYSVYLIHKGVMHLDDVYLGSWESHGRLAHTAVYLVSIFAVASILFLCVERTGFKVRDRYLTRQLREKAPAHATA